MSNRIDDRFRDLRSAERSGLIPFITAGDPQPEATVPLMHSMVKAGADLLELGVPFSDPMADGPVIQASSERAIMRGITLSGVLDMVARFRTEDQQTPVILMGYMNPVERLGYAALAAQARQSGVDALLLVDCPPEEASDLRQELEANNIHQIFLVAPTTTPARCQKICASAGGFVYYVSLKGVTGADQKGSSAGADQASSSTGTEQAVSSGIADKIAMIRNNTSLPVAVGFGIKDGRSAAAAALVSNAVVVGSALVEQLKSCDSIDSACKAAEIFVARLRSAIDNKDKSIAC